MRKSGEYKKAFKAAFPYTVPIFAGFWFLGITYGIYMNVSGFPFWYPMIMSVAISDVFAVSAGQADAEVYPLSRQGFAGVGVRTFGGLLPEKRQRIFGQSRHAGIDCNCRYGGAAFVEKADAFVDCGRYALLYAACAVGILMQIFAKSLTKYICNSIIKVTAVSRLF